MRIILRSVLPIRPSRVGLLHRRIQDLWWAAEKDGDEGVEVLIRISQRTRQTSQQTRHVTCKHLRAVKGSEEILTGRVEAPVDRPEARRGHMADPLFPIWTNTPFRAGAIPTGFKFAAFNLASVKFRPGRLNFDRTLFYSGTKSQGQIFISNHEGIENIYFSERHNKR